MPRNIVLLVLDTVREDYFDKHASRLQRMGDVTFEQCRTASSCSVPSHASMMTGELPHQHGIHSEAVDYSDLDDGNTFLGDLPAHRAIGVSTNTFAGAPFGFDNMFDEFVDVSWTRRFHRGMDAREFVTLTDASGVSLYTEFLKTALRHDHPLSTMGNAALAQLDVVFSKLPVPKLLDDGANAALRAARNHIDAIDEPFFLFVNLMEAHTPHQPTLHYERSLYDAPNDWSSITELDQWEINRSGKADYEKDVRHFRNLYAASIDYLDRKVSTFIETVRAETNRETTFVITSDHGENLGYPADEGLFGHNSSLSEAVLHVPLTIINPPEGYSKRETEYFSHLELGRLLAGLADNRTPEVFSDRIPAERILTTNIPDVSDEEHDYWNRMLRCVYEGGTKFVWDSLGECIEYELDAERPCWQREYPARPIDPPSWADEFFNIDIETFKSHVGSDHLRDVDDATQARLEELGYL